MTWSPTAADEFDAKCRLVAAGIEGADLASVWRVFVRGVHAAQDASLEEVLNGLSSDTNALHDQFGHDAVRVPLVLASTRGVA